jgi:NTP pyrophosphatase (non-canonical NTP hydrolase)
MDHIYDYPLFVQGLAKPGADILRSLDEDDAYLIHMAMGISGEAGELLDGIKKATIYRKPIDINHIIEEMGDIEFFLQGIRNHFGWSRDDIIKANHGKLSRRYPNGYSNQAAQTRADKA